jgi:hypothetical protein
MKKLYIITIALFACQLNVYNQDLYDRATVRLYGSFGSTLAVPMLNESGSPITGSYIFPGYTKMLDTLSFGSGIQILFRGQKLRMGLDAGYLRMFNNTATLDTYDGYGKTKSNYQHKESALRLMLIAHYSPSGIFFLEGGVGPHMIFLNYHYDHSEDFGWKIETYNIGKKGKEFTWGLMAAIGANIPVSENVSIPIYARIDYLFRYGYLIPVTLNSGITFRF